MRFPLHTQNRAEVTPIFMRRFQKQVLEWTIDFANVKVDIRFNRALELASKVSREILEKVEGLPVAIDDHMDKAEEALARGETYGCVLSIKFTGESFAAFNAEVARLKSLF